MIARALPLLGFLCLSVSCGDVVECASSAECPSSQLCVNGACELAPPDSGTCFDCCTPGTRLDCGPDPEMDGVGICKSGFHFCDTEGSLGPCEEAVFPTVETCNGADDDCDGEIDESVKMQCWADQDGDGYALATASSIEECGSCGADQTAREPIAGNVDCDDENSARHPGAVELCDRFDSDCTSEDEIEIGEDEDMDEFAPLDAACEGNFPKTDCYDQNADALPGQEMHFATDRGDGSFDYNCDETEEPASTSLGRCISGSCILQPGWLGAAPACGISGSTLAGCRPIPWTSTCAPMAGSSPQRCR